MKSNTINKLVIFMICMCMVVGIFTAYQRFKVEDQYKTTEIALDFDEMVKFADASEKSLEFWLKEFKKLGAASAVIPEETINTLIKQGNPIRTAIVGEIIKEYDWESKYPQSIIDLINNDKLSINDAILTVDDSELYNYIMEGLSLRYPSELYKGYEDNDTKYIVFNCTADDTYYSGTSKAYDSEGAAVYEIKKAIDSKVFNIGIGYSKEKIDLAKSAGLDVVLRPINYSRYSEKLVSAYEQELKKYDLVPRLYIATGKETLGYPNAEEEFQKFIKDNDVITVLIETSSQRENIEQDGITDLVKASGYNTVRAFTMWDFIRLRYQDYGYQGAEEIENSMYRAITERNIRLIYFKPFYEDDNKYLTDVAEYERTFDSLSERLAKHDITLAKTEPISEFHIGNLRLSILCLGVGLAAAYLLVKLFRLNTKASIVLYILSCVSFVAPLVARGLSEKLFAFGSAVTFSGLAVLYMMNKIKSIGSKKNELPISKVIINSIVILVTSSLIALIGALFIVSILSDIEYMLELDIYRGVKASQLLPFVIFIFALILNYTNSKKNLGLKDVIKPVSTVLNANIKVYYILLACILGFVGYIYIARTGHETNIQPSVLEMMFRNFLENVLLARPRTKEFLIAFPAVFGAVYAANKKVPFVAEAFMLAAVIGTSSIINTFCHIRTPLYLSLVRTFISVGFGIIIGCVLIAVLSIIFKLFTKLQERL